jgi:hypothetical protein
MRRSVDRKTRGGGRAEANLNAGANRKLDRFRTDDRRGAVALGMKHDSAIACDDGGGGTGPSPDTLAISRALCRSRRLLAPSSHNTFRWPISAPVISSDLRLAPQGWRNVETVIAGRRSGRHRRFRTCDDAIVEDISRHRRELVRH